MKMMNVTEHFTIEELTRTTTGLMNIPDIHEIAALTQLAEMVLEPIRRMLGVPIIIHSGFRCEAVNTAVGGQEKSQHRRGEAADFHAQGWSITDTFNKIRYSEIPYDQLIHEYQGNKEWIHVSFNHALKEQRRMAFNLTKKPVVV